MHLPKLESSLQHRLLLESYSVAIQTLRVAVQVHRQIGKDFADLEVTEGTLEYRQLEKWQKQHHSMDGHVV
jgi:hypothetical protein